MSGRNSAAGLQLGELPGEPGSRARTVPKCVSRPSSVPATIGRPPSCEAEPARRFLRRSFARGRPMTGLMMDYPLTLSTIFRRGETLFRRREIVSRLPDKSLHRYTYARLRRPHAAPRRRLVPPRHPPRRSRRHARLEPLAASRGLLRHPAHGRRPPHAEPPPPPRRARLHRQPRGGPRRPRRREPAAALEPGPASRQRPDQSSSSAPPKPVPDGPAGVRSAARRCRRPRPTSRTPTSATPPRCATRPAPPASRKACSTRTASLVLHTFGARAEPLHGHLASATPCCRSCRCSTPTRGACPSPA